MSWRDDRLLCGSTEGTIHFYTVDPAQVFESYAGKDVEFKLKQKVLLYVRWESHQIEQSNQN